MEREREIFAAALSEISAISTELKTRRPDLAWAIGDDPMDRFHL